MSNQKGLIGIIILFLLVILVGLMIAFLIYLKNIPQINIFKHEPSPEQLKALHERNFVNPQ